MKKIFFLIANFLFSVASLFADPVDVPTAMALGKKFVKAHFEQKQNQELTLAYTVRSTAGTPCIYVFNVSDYGFVLMSADNCAHPVLGYCDNNAFDTNNVVPGLRLMMNEYQREIRFAVENAIQANAAIAAEWTILERSGNLKSGAKGNGVDPLLSTTWDQNYPYNYYCPADSNSPGGHVYAGYVACAMAQIMKYWEYPIQGVGSHSYTSPGYPQQTVNFGATTYNWSNMPNSITPNSSQSSIQAIATLMYHCEVSVEME